MFDLWVLPIHLGAHWTMLVCFIHDYSYNNQA